MRSDSRRAFLKTGLAFGALVALGGQRGFGEESVATVAPSAMSIADFKAAELPAADIPSLDVLGDKLTVAAIESLGGMKRFVSKGDVVWIKPNIGWNRSPELAANTHPAVVAALIRMCFDAGAAKVRVGDNPCNRAQDCYVNSGIAPAAEKLGAEVVYLDRKRFLDHNIGGNRLKKIPVYPDILDCDVVINVPVAKHHGSTTVTLCMKNYMGVVESRGTFHQDLPTCIADMTAFMKPKLCVVDATRVLTSNGPTGGDLAYVKRLNKVAAGTDIVALDAFGCELLGHKPLDIGTVAKGVEYKFGTADYMALNPKLISLSA